MSDELYDNARWLIAATVNGLEERLDNEGAREVLDRLAAQDIAEEAYRSPVPRRLPACRHMPAMLGELAMTQSGVAAAIAAVEDELCWQQNSNYSDEAMGQPGYMDNYAYAEIIGPSGIFPGGDFLLGLLILGPGLHYREHFHPAPELYWTLTGPCDWRTATGDFASREAGETIWHPPFLIHATRTGAKPLLALWAWTRDVAEPARLTGA